MTKCSAPMNHDTLRRHAGCMRQVAGVRRAVLDDGTSRGVRVADVYDGAGLSFTVLLDRGMDIGPAFFRGTPLAFVTPGGFAHPAFYESDGPGWLRNWGGGLLTGCGLRNVGLAQPQADPPVAGPLGLHGRLSNIPAEQCATAEEWRGDEYRLAVSGLVRESSLFAENLELRRTISTRMGSGRITIEDRVTNMGFRPSPLMLLYHINAGFPMVGERSRLVAPPHPVVPRTPGAAAGLAEWERCQAPTPGYAEQCFYHDLPAGADGMARMRLESPDAGLWLEVACRKRELPFFTQWKMMGEGEYVMGLEPANCHPDGQQREREAGTLREIAPGESIDFLVEIAAGAL